ncbi:GNAT family N-acetyltransferase [Micromonospora sp. ALFpr18c]|uniref:GNAT family N-acetyltransferase n=1 Tax=unclassified Micromonospora TaxID=2617518 RepID=UPI00124B4EB0|nr:GNAT family N-acetyltransferase [Micromonospora sp. ALFpr18c]KAB1941373.1 GNAT family N-acetyltransferase [Micromonospora sp. ALFpr18c]
MPRLVRITQDNVEAACRLTVRPEQEKFVSPVAWSLAEAYAQPEIAWPRLIVEGDEIVGFLMGFFDIGWHPDQPDDLRSGLWRLNIAAEHQGRGYGRFAVRAVRDEARARGRDRVYTTWEPGRDGPEAFYLKLGFDPTGEISGGQVVGVCHLTE